MENSTVLGRLLEELSWVGSTIRTYREGGRGFENVLTAEAFQALDFLPRSTFLGEVISSAHGADEVRDVLVSEIEDATILLLPGNHYLIPSAPTHQTGLSVQPDGLISTASTYTTLEAKRIRSSSFQPEQLAREYVLALRNAEERMPLLLLIVGSPPPFLIAKNGRHTISSAIELFLSSVLERAEGHELSFDEAASRIGDVVAWITWQEISDIVQSQIDSYVIDDKSARATVERLATSVVRAIKWHG